MKWILFTGTWRLTDEEVERDVRAAAREVIVRGDGIITGGATGVDYFAMDEGLKAARNPRHVRAVIPAYLESYLKDYYDNWCQAPVTRADIDALGSLLRKMKAIDPINLIEMPYTTITQEHYNRRHDEEIKYASEVHAFQVNESTGTQDTIDKALRAGLPISVHKKYTI